MINGFFDEFEVEVTFLINYLLYYVYMYFINTLGEASNASLINNFKRYTKEYYSGILFCDIIAEHYTRIKCI